MAIVIYPVKRIVRRWLRFFAHIFNEHPEVIPPGTDLYAASAVPMIAYVVWVIATLAHSHPRYINRVFGFVHICSLVVLASQSTALQKL